MAHDYGRGMAAHLRTAVTEISRQRSVAVGLILLGVFAWSCGNGSESGISRIERTGILRVGTDATYPPFESIDAATGEVMGFDIDLVREVCAELGCAPDFVVVPFDGIVAGLVSNKYDMIASTFTVTPERARRVAYTTPYYTGGQALAVPAYDTVTRGVDDLRGRRIGVQLGTTGERRARLVPDAEVVSFENIGAAFIDMENGHLDAVINDIPTAELIIRR
ncbi:MAG TPA: transporter substrate-binding domain-containing protein, partial [Acidobacteriota bacterium]|nr:transporter substrate-binding domain-containing protein [Acidobacteriota bacterium]